MSGQTRPDSPPPRPLLPTPSTHPTGLEWECQTNARWRPGEGGGARARRLSGLWPKLRSLDYEISPLAQGRENHVLFRGQGPGKVGGVQRAGRQRMGAGSPTRFWKRGRWGPTAWPSPTSVEDDATRTGGGRACAEGTGALPRGAGIWSLQGRRIRRAKQPRAL